MLLIFIVGYFLITLEHPLKLNKAATALLMGVLCWTVYVFMPGAEDGKLFEHLSEISGVLFFLLGAMTIVELIDAHEGFDVITNRISTLSRRKLLIILSVLAFLLSAVLDNLTTAIVMIALVRKLVRDDQDRFYYAGAIIIAANAGGAWSPIGDVTTTMLWVGGQITSWKTISTLFFPALVSVIIPVMIIGYSMKGSVERPGSIQSSAESETVTSGERYLVLLSAIVIMLLVPVFKMVTGLPPFMGMLLGVGVLWLITELIHKRKNDEHKSSLSVAGALQRIDTPSVLFFLGILLAVSALDSAGYLADIGAWVSNKFENLSVVTISIGLFSALVDNVPLVAATQGMYPLEQFATDHYFWQFLAYCAGTGGSILIIGSAAGVAVMGMEKISFLWYLRRVSLPALIGYLAGAGVFILMNLD